MTQASPSLASNDEMLICRLESYYGAKVPDDEEAGTLGTNTFDI